MRSSDELIDKAERLEAGGEDHLALEIWKQVAESHPSMFVFCRIGRLYQKLDLPEDAVASFEQALTLAGDSALPLTLLGSLKIHRGDFSAAATYLRRAVSLEPTAGASNLLGVALASMGRDTEAESAYRDALRIDQNYEEACYNLGALLKRTNFIEAEGLLERALALDPNYAIAHRELGFLLAKRDPGPIAEYHLRRAAELNPSDPWTHVYTGAYLEKIGDFDAAVREYETAADFEPNRAFPLWPLGKLHEHRGNWGRAKAVYESAVQLEPNDMEANVGLGRIFSRIGDIVMAREYLNRALFLDPDSKIALQLLDELGSP